jgi:hypothetical protein
MDGDLLCPECGGFYLHHSTVTVFTRSEEDAESVTMIVGLPVFANLDNPSKRRDGVAIRFACEGCEFEGELTIAQVKGYTNVEWR